jgi:hypothetical protein
MEGSAHGLIYMNRGKPNKYQPWQSMPQTRFKTGFSKIQLRSISSFANLLCDKMYANGNCPDNLHSALEYMCTALVWCHVSTKENERAV